MILYLPVSPVNTVISLVSHICTGSGIPVEVHPNVAKFPSTTTAFAGVLIKVGPAV